MSHFNHVPSFISTIIRQRLVEAFGSNAIVKMKTPEPEKFCLDALHVRPQQESAGKESAGKNSRAVVLCPGANGYYEDSFTSTLVQVCHCVVEVILYRVYDEAVALLRLRPVFEMCFASVCFTS